MDSFTLVEMTKADQVDVQGLIGRAMNRDELEYAKQTFDFHFNCLAVKSDVALDSMR